MRCNAPPSKAGYAFDLTCPACRCNRRTEPEGERVAEPGVRAVTNPCDMAVWPHQHRREGVDFADHRKLPRAGAFRVHVFNPVRPRRDVQTIQRREVQQQRPRRVHQLEYAYRFTGDNDVEIRHASPQERMAFAKVVMNIESAHFPNHAFARFIHAQPTQRAAYQLVWTADRSLRAREGCRRRFANGSRRQACSIRHNASKSHGAASSINACDTSLMRTSAFRSRRSSRMPLALSATTVRRRSFLSMRVLTNPCA